MLQKIMESQRALRRNLAQKLSLPLESLVIEETTERVYIPDASLFDALLQQHHITQLSTGGGYHFVFPIEFNGAPKYWKITLAAAEHDAFRQHYAPQYTIRNRKTLPGAFY